MPAFPAVFSSLFRTPVSRGAFVIGAFSVFIATLTRLVLVATLARQTVTFDSSLAVAFAVGFAWDVLAAFYASLVWVALAAFVAGKNYGWARVAVLAAVVAVLWKFLSPHGWPAWVIPAMLFGAAVCCTFGRLSGRVFTLLLLGCCIAALLFGAVSEWFFWEEFGVRFNFIAVDYLVYTNEVIANINESYPMPVILGALGAATGLVLLFFWKAGVLRWIAAPALTWKNRATSLAIPAALFVLTTWMFSQSQHPKFANSYNAELAKNGLYSFGAAFWENEIDYDTFYPTRDPAAVFQGVRQRLATADAPMASDAPQDLRRSVKPPGAEKHWNVILVCVESLSGEFLGALGNKRGLTPHLDRIASEGIFFRHLYATGTRTIRGMEALTLSVPPTPGQSLIRRPECAGLFSIGFLFQNRGYDSAFIYGGDGRFDNMNEFFSHNGYRVVDRGAKSSSDITFENAWGACDGDLFDWTITEADRAHAAGRPFHYFCMTTSNHRPFTFPEAGVDLNDSSGKPLTDGRKRTVKYTDHAINQLLEKSRSKPWFASTLFVIVADHCASSAGKVELDVTKFHIPAILWNPSLIQPHASSALCSQIDVMPTVFSLMNWSYTSRFFGQNVLSPDYNGTRRRAFVSNYQKVAVLHEDRLTILKPKKQSSLYRVELRDGGLAPLPDDAPDHQALLNEAIDYYQSAAWLFKNGHLKSDASAP